MDLSYDVLPRSYSLHRRALGVLAMSNKNIAASALLGSYYVRETDR